MCLDLQAEPKSIGWKLLYKLDTSPKTHLHLFVAGGYSPANTKLCGATGLENRPI